VGCWDNHALENQGYSWANHARPGESKARGRSSRRIGG
jgi:hypothetical protein